MPTEYSDVVQLVAAIELEDIYCGEERGRRIQWSEEELAGRTFPSTTNTLGISREGTSVYFRFRALFTDRSAEYAADWTAEFTLPDEVDVADLPLLEEFAERVAFFAVYPYIRASIYGSASRLNQPVPVLGIVRQGQFERGDRLSEEESTTEFAPFVSERLETS
jgi:hypothetical protein